MAYQCYCLKFKIKKWTVRLLMTQHALLLILQLGDNFPSVEFDHSDCELSQAVSHTSASCC